MPVGIRNSNTIGGKKIIKKISKPKTKPKMRGGKGGYIYHYFTDLAKDGNRGKIVYLKRLKEELAEYYTEIDNCYNIIIENESYTQEKDEINDKHKSTIKIKIFLDKLIDFSLYLLGYLGDYYSYVNLGKRLWDEIKTHFNNENNIDKNNDNENTQIISLLNAIAGGKNKEKYFEDNITIMKALEKNLPERTKETANYILIEYSRKKDKGIKNKDNTIEELLNFFEWLLFEYYKEDTDRIIIIISIIDNIYKLFLRNLTYFQEKLNDVKEKEKEKEKKKEKKNRRLSNLIPLPPPTSNTEGIVDKELEIREQKFINIKTTLLTKINNIKEKFDSYFNQYKDEVKDFDKSTLPHYNNFIYIYNFLIGLINLLVLNFYNSDHFSEKVDIFYNSIKDNDYHNKINEFVKENLYNIGKKEDARHVLVMKVNRDGNLNGNIIPWLLKVIYTTHNDRLDILINVVDVIYIHFSKICIEYVTDVNVCSGGASKVVVKKTLNPYNKYVAKQFPSMKKKFPDDKAPQIMQKIAIEWNKMKK
jgi:hypothetical protein